MRNETTVFFIVITRIGRLNRHSDGRFFGVDMIKIKADARETVRWFDNVQKKQLPFACSRALNAVAKDVKTAEQMEMKSVFAAPKAYTVNSVFVRKYARKADLTAVVDFKDGGRGRSAAKYLAAQIEGGSRRQKAVESLLIGRGLMPAGMKIVPAAVKLDQYGNITLGTFRRLVAGVVAGTHFALHRQHGKLEPGLYQRSKRGKVKPLLIYVSGASYGKRFKYFETAERTVQSKYRQHFDRELANAVATAR